MKSVVTVLLTALVVCQGQAQAPDVRIKGDLSFSLIRENQNDFGFRAYTPLMRFSTVTLQTMLPIGFRVNLSQRVSNLEGDADSDPLDEYYIEDVGSWRIGKQYLPFGGGVLFRETAKAARVDSSLIFEGLPLSFALVENGQGRQSGVVSRLGSRGQGISAAIGRHWGINGTALVTIRSIGSGLGVGKGWRQAYSVDWNRRFGKVSSRVEAVFLRQPETVENEMDILDLQVTYDLGRKHSAVAGLSQVLGNPSLWWRVGGSYTAQKGVQIEGLLRTQSGSFVDLSVMLRLRF
jgi:hypothetical protein